MFRWVENGCLTEEEPKEKDPEAYHWMLEQKGGYLTRVDKFSTITGLYDYAE